MKKLLIPVIALILGSCGGTKNNTDKLSTGLVTNTETANGTVDKSNLPILTFKEDTYDFGKIIQGEKVSHTFNFTNEGKSNLIISSAQASCGCTVAQPPKDPIAPGKADKIDVVFDSNGKSGSVTKTISVLTNCEPNTILLTIKGEVIVPSTNESK